MWRAIRPAIDFEGAGFLGQAFAANDEPGLGLRQVFTAQVADGYGVPFLGPPFHGIEASFDIAEKLPGLAAGLIGGQSTGLANRKASRLALTIAKLDHDMTSARSALSGGRSPASHRPTKPDLFHPALPRR